MVLWVRIKKKNTYLNTKKENETISKNTPLTWSTITTETEEQKFAPNYIRNRHPEKNVIAELNAPMMTRSKARNTTIFYCIVSIIEPKNSVEALLDDCWFEAM